MTAQYRNCVIDAMAKLFHMTTGKTPRFRVSLF